MSKGNEIRLVWYPLRHELSKLHWDHQRIEDKLSVGIPDLNIHIPGRGDVWVELKYIPKLANSIDLGLRREQYIWMLRGQRAGRTVYLLARIGGSGWYLWRDAKSWALAKGPTPLDKLIIPAIFRVTPAGVLAYLATTSRCR